VYAGIDPITKREIRLKATAKTEQQAHIELGRLLKEASEGRMPESDATMAPTTTHYALLGLLAIRPWPAYELVGQSQRVLGFLWPWAESKVYESVKRLTALGLARRAAAAHRAAAPHGLLDHPRRAAGPAGMAPPAGHRAVPGVPRRDQAVLRRARRHP
jgi:hypothetical protein